MKENYEALEMEVVAFDGEIFTETAYTDEIVSNRDGYIVPDNSQLVPGVSQGPFATAGN